jgi:3-dehydroquinate dehydratase-1
MHPKPIELNGKPLGGNRFPAICAPLVARTPEALLAETRAVAAKKPDLLEWRVDFFEHIADVSAVVEMAGLIRQASSGIPVLFTRRSITEGGQKISLSEEDVVAMYRAVAGSGDVDMLDFEMSNDADHVRQIREMSRANGLKLILSFHDFSSTPAADFIAERFAQAEALGADVAKVAVMPHGMEDVLTLLAATLRASKERGIPVVSMSMAGFGSVTRVCGWAFGSAMTFAIGHGSSAPGQMPIEDLTMAMQVLRQGFGASSG